MVNQIGSTEGQSQEEHNLYSAMYKRPYPGKKNQVVTDLLPHDGQVVQGLTDCHIAVNSHEYQHKNLQASK
jgi:hypothetical protein